MEQNNIFLAIRRWCNRQEIRFDLSLNAERFFQKKTFYFGVLALCASIISWLFLGALNIEIVQTIGDYTYPVQSPTTLKLGFFIGFIFVIAVLWLVNILIKITLSFIAGKLEESITDDEKNALNKQSGNSYRY